MKNEYFIGIVPPDDQMKQIKQFQGRWLTNPGVEPHITLKAQGGLTPDKGWIDQVIQVCDQFPPFSLSLGEPEYFNDSVLYLSVKSSRLYDLHKKIVLAISPCAQMIKKYFELDDFVPHLTLGKEQYGIPGKESSGLSKKDLAKMKKQIENEWRSFPPFYVEKVRIYELNYERQRYEPYLDIPLKRDANLLTKG